jgi:SAM-dependent methyltransferase
VASDQSSALALRARLVLAAFLMLFVELALIRWLGANVLYLAYFSNVVLLGSFLGIGLGFLWTSRSETPLYRFAPLALTTLVVLVRVLDVKVGVAGEQLIFFNLDSSGPPRWVVLPVVFVAVATVMLCLGEGVARSFQRLANLDAYQFDLIGSVLGVIAFALLSLAQLDPWVWASITAVGLIVAIAPRRPATIVLSVAPLAVFLGVLVVESNEADTVWTPYYKVGIEPIGESGAVIATVNGIPTWLQEVEPGDNALYRTVYEQRTRDTPGDMLVIGSGSGNDVALAVQRGAEHVDAVEIDPHLLELGRGHPLAPYDDPRVDAHVTDGRAFLEASDHRWDTILLALPDSLTLLQGQSSVRLESYLFTEEAVEAYRDHLAEGGVFAMYNYYREPWLVDRYAATLERVFGEPPCVTTLAGDTSAVIVVSEDPSQVDCPTGSTFAGLASAPDPATDDHPFPYLRTPSIPSFYLVALGFMLALSVIGVRLAGGPFRQMVPFADLFFMGVAFLLLETKNVVQFALLFGTTWFVNAFVFGGVLISVLLAVAISKRVVIRNTARLYAVLIAGIALNWLVPAHVLLELPMAPRLVAAVALAFFPIFVANLVFASRFRDTERSTAAFGANLLGAMVGGLLEYVSLLTGYRSLLVLVAGLYGLAFLLRPRIPVAASA